MLLPFNHSSISLSFFGVVFLWGLFDLFSNQAPYYIKQEEKRPRGSHLSNTSFSFPIHLSMYKQHFSL